MSKLNRAALWSLEDYADRRSEFRTQVIDHKKNRRVALGANATLYFEDLMTMKYQVQEMLRTERIFEGSGIEEELATYNPLIPDGANLKATLMIEYSDVDERRVALEALVGVEHTLWLRAGDNAKIHAIANEDLERSTEEKTSAVHFLRFELDVASIAAFKAGEAATFGSDHPALKEISTLTLQQQQSLAADLD